MENNENQINIELSAEVAEGIYSNLAIISHSSSEFVLDFIRIMPGLPKAPVKSRIILTPEHAKRLLYALQRKFCKIYEPQNGKIKIDENSFMPPFPMGFGGGEA
jgi:predicted transcriptional regulator